jgi:hypothetical protein
MSHKDARNEWPWAFPVEWAWGDEKNEYYTAGFKTKEEAIEHVKWTANEEEWEQPRKISIGHTVWPEPGMYAWLDAGELAGQIDENAYGDGCYTDDEELFDFDNQEIAQAELAGFLSRWANRHLKPCKWTFKKIEEITVSKDMVSEEKDAD